MLHIEYRVLCSIGFAHSYYQSGRSADFSLRPSAETGELLDSLGLVLRQTAERTLILQKMDEGAPENPLAAPVCLRFLVYINNPLLWNVSRFSWTNAANQTESARQFYFSNANRTDGQLRAVLTEEPTLSAKDALPPIQPQRFSLPMPAVPPAQLVIERFTLNTGWQPMPPVSIPAGQQSLEINLREPGLYRLPDGLDPPGRRELYVSDAAARSGPYFGVVDLYLDDSIMPGTDYSAYIAYREHSWQYVLIDVRNKKVPYGTVDDIQISFTRHAGDTLSPDTVHFARIADAQLNPKLRATIERIKESNADSVENVFVFGSDVPIPILEHRPPTVELGISGNTNFAKLPVPDLGTVNIQGDKSLIYYNI